MTVTRHAQQLYAAYQHRELKPVGAGELPNASPGLAYQVQQALVAKIAVDSPIVGYKAAVTAEHAQRSLGASEPVCGVLFEAMQLPVTGPISISRFQRGVVETEVGLRIATAIDREINSDELPAYIDYCLPMIELGDVGFVRPPDLHDLIAGNAAAAHFLAGKRSAITAINDVEVTLTRDGEQLHAASARDAMGDQFAAATWLINRSIRQGYAVNPGHYLMTGSLGQVQMMQPGSYVADYGSFGVIEFVITD